MHMTTHQCLFCASIANSTLHRNVYQPSLYEHVWGGFCPIQLLQIPTGESTYSVLWLIALISNWHCHPCVRTFVRSAFLRIVMAQAIHPVSRWHDQGEKVPFFQWGLYHQRCGCCGVRDCRYYRFHVSAVSDFLKCGPETFSFLLTQILVAEATRTEESLFSCSRFTGRWLTLEVLR